MKIGDKVRLISDYLPNMKKGEIGIIAGLDVRGTADYIRVIFKGENKMLWFCESELEVIDK